MSARRLAPQSPYFYVQGPVNLGVGVDNVGLVRPHDPIPSGSYRPRYMVHRNMDLVFPGALTEAQSLPTVDIKANGAYLAGTWGLDPLSKQKG